MTLTFDDAISVIESCSGFSDDTTPVGEAWAVVRAAMPPADTVTVPRELFESLVDYAGILVGEWDWKEGYHKPDYEELKQYHREAVAIRDSSD